MKIRNASDISCQLLFLHESPHLRTEAFSMACGHGSSRVQSLIRPHNRWTEIFPTQHQIGKSE